MANQTGSQAVSQSAKWLATSLVFAGQQLQQEHQQKQHNRLLINCLF